MASQYLNATCSICSKKYHMCASCKDLMALQPWKIHTDTAEHYKIYQVLLGYNTKVYDIAEAKARLLNIDLSDKDIYATEIKEVINEILAYENKANVAYEDKEDKPVEVEKPVENDTTKKVKPTSKKGKKANKTVETDIVDD